MPDSIFSDKALEQHVDKVIDRSGRSADVGVELQPGERPAVILEAQGERAGEKVTVGWGAYLRTQFTKAKTTIGGKIGFKW